MAAVEKGICLLSGDFIPWSAIEKYTVWSTKDNSPYKLELEMQDRGGETLALTIPPNFDEFSLCRQKNTQINCKQPYDSWCELFDVLDSDEMIMDERTRELWEDCKFSIQRAMAVNKYRG